MRSASAFLSLVVCSTLSGNTCLASDSSAVSSADSSAGSLKVAATDPAVGSSRAKPRITTFSPLVTGNGYGYAVVDTKGDVTRLYAHPYRFERPNEDIKKDGPSTANTLKTITWGWVRPTAEKYKFFPPINGNAGTPETHYLNDSHLIATKSAGNETVYFMPFDLKRNALIAVRRPIPPATDTRQASDQSTEASAAGTWTLNPVWEHKVQSEQTKKIGGNAIHVVTFKDIEESLVLVPLDLSQNAINARENHGDYIEIPTKSKPDEPHYPGNAWAIVVLEKPEDAEQAAKDVFHWQHGEPPDVLISRELKNLEAWRLTPNVQFKSEEERKLWRQQETIFRMSQIREENREGRYNHGLILASLPDGIWFTPWVRDMAYALVGLVRMGHVKEAREGILSWFNAHPVARWKQDTRDMDYQISVTRYYGDGSEESDFSGQKTENCEFDDWGLALWAISEYWQSTHDKSLLSEKTYRGDTVYESMRDFVVKPLLGNLDSYGDGLIVAEDSSCWEEHQENKHHYACSTIAAIPGLRGFLKIAEEMHDEETTKLVREKLDLLEKGFKSAFLKDGFVQGIVETKVQPKSEVDGAAIEAFNFDIVKDPAIFEQTLIRMEELKRASGGYRRNLGPSNYEAHEFLLIDFNLARACFKFGKTTMAENILETLVDKSMQDHGLIAEMYVSEKGKDCPGAIGDPAGSIPMVGFGAGDFVITLTDREKYARSSDQPGAKP